MAASRWAAAKGTSGVAWLAVALSGLMLSSALSATHTQVAELKPPGFDERIRARRTREGRALVKTLDASIAARARLSQADRRRVANGLVEVDEITLVGAKDDVELANKPFEDLAQSLREGSSGLVLPWAGLRGVGLFSFAAGVILPVAQYVRHGRCVIEPGRPTPRTCFLSIKNWLVWCWNHLNLPVALVLAMSWGLILVAFLFSERQRLLQRPSECSNAVERETFGSNADEWVLSPCDSAVQDRMQAVASLRSLFEVVIPALLGFGLMLSLLIVVTIDGVRDALHNLRNRFFILTSSVREARAQSTWRDSATTFLTVNWNQQKEDGGASMNSAISPTGVVRNRRSSSRSRRRSPAARGKGD